VYGSFLGKLKLVLFPTSILALTHLCAPYLTLLSQPWRAFTPYATSLMLLLGIFLSLHFNRGRAFFVFLILFFYHWYCFSIFQGGWGATFANRIDKILWYLIPVNITLFSLMREKGIFTLAGRMRFVFLVVQAGLLFLLGKSSQAVALQTDILLKDAVVGNHDIPRFAFLLMEVCVMTVAVRSFRKQSFIESGFLGALLAVVWILCMQPNTTTLSVFLLAAGLILTVSILQDFHTMAYRDDLTGLLSRRVLNEDLQGLGRRYAIAMLDMDHFKRLNDSYGHDAGDQVLCMAADRMRKVGAGCKAYRYGGEEFTILFPRKGLVDVLPLLDGLRSSIASYRFRLRGRERPGRDKEGKKLRTADNNDTHISVTVSIGVAESDSDRKNPRDVLAAADEALYRAKQRGRNRVVSVSVT
jgi:GGDEF domain-containing protein